MSLARCWNLNPRPACCAASNRVKKNCTEQNNLHYGILYPIPVAARCKARVCGPSLAGIAGSNPHGCLSVVSVVCCQVEVSASGRSLV